MVPRDRPLLRQNPQQLLANHGEVSIELQKLGPYRGDIEEDRPARAADVQIKELVERNQKLFVVNLIKNHRQVSRGNHRPRGRLRSSLLAVVSTTNANFNYESITAALTEGRFAKIPRLARTQLQRRHDLTKRLPMIAAQHWKRQRKPSLARRSP